MSEISSISGQTDTGLNDLFMELDSYCLFEAPKLLNNQSTEGQFHEEDGNSNCSKQNSTQTINKQKDDSLEIIPKHPTANNHNKKMKTQNNHLNNFQELFGIQEDASKMSQELPTKNQKDQTNLKYESKKSSDNPQIDMHNYTGLMKQLPKLHEIYDSEDQLQSLNSSIFWLMVCAEYFPRKMLFEKYQCNDLLKRLNQLPIVIKLLKSTNDIANESYYLNDINKANSNSTQLKTSKKRANLLNCNTKWECEGNSRSYESISSKEQSIPTIYERQSEHISPNQCSSGNETNIIFVSDDNQDCYSLQDDVNILQQRIMLIELMKEKYTTQESNNNSNQQILCDQSQQLKELKEMELDSLIRMLEESEKYCINQKEIQLSCLQERIDLECHKEEIMFKNGVDLEDGLIDMCPPHLGNTNEKQFIEMLKNQQKDKREKQIQLLRESNAQEQIIGVQQRKAETQLLQDAQTQKDQENNNNNNNMEESACQICNEADSFDNNLIVFCSLCNISVHQLCYGIVTIPSGDWICKACIQFGSESQFIPCGLCPNLGGALKPSSEVISTNFFRLIRPKFHQYLLHDVSSSCVGKSTKSQIIWMHLTCAMWMPECYFVHPESSDGIAGIQNIDNRRFFRTCQVCLKKKTGSCLKCHEKSCKASFHPECARRAGLALGLNPADTQSNVIYCQLHAPLGLVVKLEQKDAKRKEDILTFLVNPSSQVIVNNDGFINPLAESDGLGGDRQVTDKLCNLLSDQNDIVDEGNKEQRKKQQEENEFMRKFSLYILKKNLSRLKKLQQQAQSQPQFLAANSLEQDTIKSKKDHKINLKMSQTYLNTKLKRDDIIFQTFRFKSLSAKKLFLMYKRLIKQKKQTFSTTFLELKMEKENKLKESSLDNQIHQPKRNINLKCPRNNNNDTNNQTGSNVKITSNQKNDLNNNNDSEDEDVELSPRMRKYIISDNNSNNSNNNSIKKIDVIIKLPLNFSSKLSKKAKIKVEYRNSVQPSQIQNNNEYQQGLMKNQKNKILNQNISPFDTQQKSKESCFQSQSHEESSYSQEGTIHNTKQQSEMVKQDNSFMQLLCNQASRLNEMLDQKAERDQQKDKSEYAFKLRRTPDGAVHFV